MEFAASGWYTGKYLRLDQTMRDLCGLWWLDWERRCWKRLDSCLSITCLGGEEKGWWGDVI